LSRRQAGFGAVSRQERRRADLFFADLLGARTLRPGARPRGLPATAEGWMDTLADWFKPHLPSAPASPRTGDEIVATLPPNPANGSADWIRREEAVIAALVAGHMPSWLRRWEEVTLERGGHRAVVRVLPDYLAVGKDDNYVLMPLDQQSAQKVADAFNVHLPTAKICHAIYKKAKQLTRIQRGPNEGNLLTTSTGAYRAHSRAIAAAMGVAPGTFVAGHKKDVVIDRRHASSPDSIAFHGFYDAHGVPAEPCQESHGRTPGCEERAAIAHPEGHGRMCDYSQGVRLLHPVVTIDGQPRPYIQVLADPELSLLLSADGPITPARVLAPPGRAPAPVVPHESVTEDCGCHGARRDDA
jgi:hypothetical protein